MIKQKILFLIKIAIIKKKQQHDLQQLKVVYQTITMINRCIPIKMVLSGGCDVNQQLYDIIYIIRLENSKSYIICRNTFYRQLH